MARGFLQLPREVAERPDLSRAAKLLYAVVKDRLRLGLGRLVGARTLGRLAGVPRTTAQQALQELETTGLLLVTRRGSGRCIDYRLPEVGEGERVKCWPERCPWVGRYLPVGGPVTCPLTGAYRPARGPVMMESTRESSERERERAGLSPLSVDFAEWMRKEKGVRVSDRQLWQINPAFAQGVAPKMIQELASEWWLRESPWAICQRALREWAEWLGGLAACRGYYVENRQAAPTVDVARAVIRYATTAELAQAFGPKVDAALAWAAGERPGVDGETATCQ